MKADKDYGLTAEGELVEQSDPRSATVLWGKGREVGDADAEKYGLTRLQGQGATGTTGEAPAAAVESKAVSAPPENKAISGPQESKAPKPK